MSFIMMTVTEKKEKKMKKIRKAFAVLLCGVLAATAFAACGGTAGKVTIKISGSSSITPLMKELAAEYEKDNDVTIMISSSDSSSGVKDAISGTSHIGMASRKLKDTETEQGVVGTKICIDGIACVVNVSNSDLTDVTSVQLYDLYMNGTALSATVTKGIKREGGSGTRDGFDSLVKNAEGVSMKDAQEDGQELNSSVISEANSTSAVTTAIKSDPSKFGYISYGSVTSDVKVLTYEGVAPSEQAIKDGSYKMQRDFTVAVNESLKETAGEAVYNAVNAFIQWILERDAAHAIISAKGCVNL